ncbi:hypothetical protein ACIGHM_29045 [Streptomyces diastaticus]|uniref:hypothetical protein n=1 Tax=Streptomyces diastaticus TaxID=1956 RepID=UPI0037CFB555
MDYAFIDDIRLSLEDTNIFSYSIKGAKMCAILLLLFSILERWGKNALNQTANHFNDMLTILGYVFLIISSDFIFETIESTFSSINLAMTSTKNTTYTDLIASLSTHYEVVMGEPDDAIELFSAMVTNITFFIGYIISLLLMAVCKIAEMSMVCGYLLARVFFLEIMKFIFPIAVALSTIKQTSGLISKWLKLYIGLSLLGLIYIGIFKICDITQTQLQNSFTSYENAGFFDSFLSMNASIWGSLITIIVVFTLKVSLFNKATSYVISFFS